MKKEDFTFKEINNLCDAAQHSITDGKPKKVYVGEYQLEVRVIWQP